MNWFRRICSAEEAAEAKLRIEADHRLMGKPPEMLLAAMDAPPAYKILLLRLPDRFASIYPGFRPAGWHPSLTGFTLIVGDPEEFDRNAA
jgi:hypothetical protein